MPTTTDTNVVQIFTNNAATLRTGLANVYLHAAQTVTLPTDTNPTDRDKTKTIADTVRAAVKEADPTGDTYPRSTRSHYANSAAIVTVASANPTADQVLTTLNLLTNKGATLTNDLDNLVRHAAGKIKTTTVVRAITKRKNAATTKPDHKPAATDDKPNPNPAPVRPVADNAAHNGASTPTYTGTRDILTAALKRLSDMHLDDGQRAELAAVLDAAREALTGEPITLDVGV